MTLDEAKKVAAIIERADSGCEHCVRGLITLSSEAFPEFKWKYDDNEDHVLVEEV